MKTLFTVTLSLLVLTSQTSFASMSTSKRKPNNETQCLATATAAVKYIDKLGWGEVENAELTFVSGSRDNSKAEVFIFKSTVSGYTYKIQLRQDAKSEACYVLSLNSK